MTEGELRETVRDAMATILELEPDELRDDADFYGELGGDSLQKLELVVALEKRLGVHFADGDAARMNSVDAIVRVARDASGSREAATR